MALAGAGISSYVVLGHLGASTSVGTPRRSSPSATTDVPGSFAQLYQSDSSGVVRLTATSCGQPDIGTGFLISPTLVATVAHVVNGSATVEVASDSNTITGEVIGLDAESDLALVRTDSSMSGHTFSLGNTEAPVGTPVGVIGFPLGGPLSFTGGSVSGLDRSIPIEGTIRSGLVQTDAALNPGNSGGPVLLSDGTVVGLADAATVGAAGIGYAVPVTQAGPLFKVWSARTGQFSVGNCANSGESGAAVPPSAIAPGPSGWLRYTDPNTGFAISYPSSWSVSPTGGGTFFRDPDSSGYLLVAYRSPAGPSAIGAWQEQEPGFAATHGNYQRVSMTGGTQDATWEYTYADTNGVLTHGLDHGFIVNNGEYGFALNWVTAESDWEALQPTFLQMQSSFVAP